MTAINYHKIEKKWQDKWEKSKIFETKKSSKKKYYVLEMFPYPSGSGLHMGHALNYTIGDIYARFMRMKKFNVLYPMGYDSLGLPAENAAIKQKQHPKIFTDLAIKNFIKQQKALGFSYDWSRLIKTSDSEYYKWNQYFFLIFLEKNLVYRKKAPVNYCSKCDTVLANEQVHNGKCWRHPEIEVEIKQLEQWFIKTTKYADELMSFVNKLNWPLRIKSMQKNWIGKSHGTEINFEIDTKSNYVLLHGYTGSPKTNFHPWLKRELEKRNCKVTIPKLPNTNNPNIHEQVNHVLKTCKFDENTVLLGHSLGSVIALKVLEELNKPIKKLVLAAGFCEPKFKDRTRPFEKTFDWKFDFNKINKNVKNSIILRASNDTAVPPERAESLKKNILGEVRDFTAEGNHICGEKEPEVLNACLDIYQIFTTRPDTLHGATFMVISAQHPKLMELVTTNQKSKVEDFLKKLRTIKQEDIDKLDKTGVFTGSYALNPLTNEKIPIWVGNFVVADYGSGMVMAVPAHDQRDFEFAKKYKIPIKIVIQPIDKPLNKNLTEAYTGPGKLINSKAFNDLNTEEAKEHITIALKNKKAGKPTTQFKLKDWLISRQRYWGTPIPIIYCKDCGIQPVPVNQLPVKLPEKVTFGKGNPLTTNKDFLETNCPKCHQPAKRETDTMDTFFDSSWYYLRFADNKNSKQPFNPKISNYWLPVDQYIGGAEHACMHLIYARFFTKALRDLKMLNFDEPFTKLFNQGMLHGEDGFVMAKSRGNVIDPLDTIKEYSADTLRLFLISVSSPDSDFNWSEKGIQGSHKLVNKIFNTINSKKPLKSSKRLEHYINKSILEITELITYFKYNLAVIKLRELLDIIAEEPISKNDLESFLKLLSPFCPHIAEELNSKINKSFISIQTWPKQDENKINKNLEKQEQLQNFTINDINNILTIMRARNAKPKTVYIYTLPNELKSFNEKFISNKLGIKTKVFAVNDPKKFDPENKSKKTKPGKPGIYIE